MNKIYLDTCIIIYLIEKHITYAVKIESLLKNLSVNDRLCFYAAYQIGMSGNAFANERHGFAKSLPIFFQSAGNARNVG